MWCDMGLKIYFFPINFPVDLPLFIARTTVFTLHCDVPSVGDQMSIKCVHSGWALLGSIGLFATVANAHPLNFSMVSIFQVFIPYSCLAWAIVCVFICLSGSICQIPHNLLLVFGWDFIDFVDESGMNWYLYNSGCIPPFIYIFFSFPWEYFVVNSLPIFC